jgi:hypothetical protein
VIETCRTCLHWQTHRSSRELEDFAPCALLRAMMKERGIVMESDPATSGDYGCDDWEKAK